jgi:REP element-mobilizing transposase RayT
MIYDPSIHHRRSIRLKGYDYSLEGAYYVTVCTRNMSCLFGKITDKEMRLNDAGKMIRSVWRELPKRFPNIDLDEFIVMPNHIHAVFIINQQDTCVCPHVRPKGTFPGTVGRILQAYKSITTDKYIAGVKQWSWKRFRDKLWQRNYWEHIIRDIDDYNNICEYIYNNPANWYKDPLNM